MNAVNNRDIINELLTDPMQNYCYFVNYTKKYTL